LLLLPLLNEIRQPLRVLKTSCIHTVEIWTVQEALE
jgi:hypothetical protein